MKLINVYGPTRNFPKEQVNFLQTIRETLNETNIPVIIGGYFNIYIDPLIDKTGGQETSKSKATETLNNLIECYNLIDVYQTMKPNTRRYTWRQSNPIIQSRIDYWLITSDIFYSVNECDIKSAIKTDHSLISLNFNNPKDEKRGPGL